MQDDTVPTAAEFAFVFENEGRYDEYHYDDSRHTFPVIVDRFKRSLERYTQLSISRDHELVMIGNHMMDMERFLNRHVKRTSTSSVPAYISVATANKILANYKDLIDMVEIRNKILDRYDEKGFCRYDGKTIPMLGTVDFFKNKTSAVMARNIAMFRDVLISRFGQVIEAM